MSSPSYFRTVARGSGLGDGPVSAGKPARIGHVPTAHFWLDLGVIAGLLATGRIAAALLAGSPVEPGTVLRLDLVTVTAATLPLWLALLDVYSRLRPEPVAAFRRTILATGLTFAIGMLVLLSAVERGHERILLEMAVTFGLVAALLPYTPFLLTRLLDPTEREPVSLLLGPEDAGNRIMRGPSAPGFGPAGRGRSHLLLKWVMDKALGTVAFVFFLPLIVLCAAAIKLADPGPAFYAQTRVGRDGRPIRVWKLRTMYVDAERRLEGHLASDPDAARQWDLYCKLQDDPRIIPVVGPLLRKTSMDELPQLLCVLNGSMSMVGPRPFPAYHVEKFPEDFQDLRCSVTPGLTGLWQISFRSDGDLTRQRLADAYYIHNWSIWLDLYILMRTPLCLFSGKGAY